MYKTSEKQQAQTKIDIVEGLKKLIPKKSIDNYDKKIKNSVIGMKPEVKIKNKLNNNSIVINVSSSGYNAGNTASIRVNDSAVPIYQNINGHHRGFHIVLINPKKLEVEWAQAYDTYKNSFMFDDFIETGDIREGIIVVAACKDECVTSLSEKGKQFFEDMGSKEIRKLEYRQGFAFIGVMGKKDANEKRS